MKILLFGLFTLFFIVSCAERKPEGILSEEKMSEVLSEVYMMDSYLNTMPIDSARKVKPVIYQNLFDRFGLDSASFVANLDYYFGNPIALEKVNTGTKKILEGYRTEIGELDSLEQIRTRDSLAVVNRWQTENYERERLIRFVKMDSSVYEFETNNNNFFFKIPINFYRHSLKRPEIIHRDTVQRDSTAIDTSAVDRGPVGIPDKLVPAPDRVIRPPVPRSKPIRSRDAQALPVEKEVKEEQLKR